MTDNRTEIEVKALQNILRRELEQMLWREVDKEDYKNYCEGIIRSCISALGNITGEYR